MKRVEISPHWIHHLKAFLKTLHGLKQFLCPFPRITQIKYFQNKPPLKQEISQFSLKAEDRVLGVPSRFNEGLTPEVIRCPSDPSARVTSDPRASPLKGGGGDCAD